MIRKRIRSGGGVGDNIYLQSIVRHLLDRGEKSLEVVTRKPEIFEPFKNRLTIAPFSRQNIHIIAHYTFRKGKPGTSQFEDMCMAAKIKEKVDLRLTWNFTEHKLADRIREKAKDKKIVYIGRPRNPMDRVDDFGIDLLPDQNGFNAGVQILKDLGFYTVMVGADKQMYNVPAVDENIAYKLSINDVFHIANISDLFYGQIGFLIPLAESLNKPGISVWSRKGLNSHRIFIRQIVPEKVLHKHSSKFINDDWKIETIQETIRNVSQF